jgi:hypothetical protein
MDVHDKPPVKINKASLIILAVFLVATTAFSVFLCFQGDFFKLTPIQNPSSSSTQPEFTEDPLASSSKEERQRITLEFPYFIEIDKGAQICTIFTTDKDGYYKKVVRYIPISSGVDDNKLPDGYYKSKETKHEWQNMFTLGEPIYCQYTTRITGNFLFHSPPYRAPRPSALNVGGYNRLGTRASGGCVRMSVENAKWIFDKINPGTTIHVVKGPERPELLASILPVKLDASAKYDPSDPDEKNPAFKSMYPNPDPEPDPYAEPKLGDITYNKDIPVTPQTTKTAKDTDGGSSTDGNTSKDTTSSKEEVLTSS